MCNFSWNCRVQVSAACGKKLHTGQHRLQRTSRSPVRGVRETRHSTYGRWHRRQLRAACQGLQRDKKLYRNHPDKSYKTTDNRPPRWIPVITNPSGARAGMLEAWKFFSSRRQFAGQLRPAGVRPVAGGSARQGQCVIANGCPGFLYCQNRLVWLPPWNLKPRPRQGPHRSPEGKQGRHYGNRSWPQNPGRCLC